MMPNAAAHAAAARKRAIARGTENLGRHRRLRRCGREALRETCDDRTRCGRSATGSSRSSLTACAGRGDLWHRRAERLANTTFFAIAGIKAETAQIAFDLAGVALSAGSACSSGKVGPSHVLKAMGHGDNAGALRVSIGHSTGDEDIAMFADALAGDRGAAPERRPR